MIMWARKRIDIRWSDLWFGFRQSYSSDGHTVAARSAESALNCPDQTIACLSVRSGFDLLLTELHLPEGSEVLVSAVTILDMVRIIESHGLVAVPVDLDPTTMQPDAESIQRAITPRTKAILVAHLFGTILDLDAIVALAQEHQLLFIEDCAQAFDGKRYIGHPGADVVMFSFGPIKTATALAGGLLIIRDQTLLDAMRTSHDTWTEQPAAEFRARVWTYSILKLVSGKRPFAALVQVLRLLGKDLDQTLNGAIRNFPADHFFASLRRRPCVGVLKLISRRIAQFDVARQDRRSHLGSLLCNTIACGLSEASVPSRSSPRHTWWVFPLCCDDRQRLIQRLRAHGFDATCGSQLQPVAVPKGCNQPEPTHSQNMVASMCFLPLYPEMTDRNVKQLGNLVADHIQTSAAS